MAFFSSLVDQLGTKAREAYEEGERFLSDQVEDGENKFLSPAGAVPIPPKIDKEGPQEPDTLPAPEETPLEPPPVAFEQQHDEPLPSREDQLVQEALKFQQEATKCKSIIKKLKDKMEQDRKGSVETTATLEQAIARLEAEAEELKRKNELEVQQLEERFGGQLQFIQHESSQMRKDLQQASDMEIAALRLRLENAMADNGELANTSLARMEETHMSEMESLKQLAAQRELEFQAQLNEQHAAQVQLQLLLQESETHSSEFQSQLGELQSQSSELHLQLEVQKTQFELQLGQATADLVQTLQQEVARERVELAARDLELSQLKASVTGGMVSADENWQEAANLFAFQQECLLAEHEWEFAKQSARELELLSLVNELKLQTIAQVAANESKTESLQLALSQLEGDHQAVCDERDSAEAKTRELQLQSNQDGEVVVVLQQELDSVKLFSAALQDQVAALELEWMAKLQASELLLQQERLGSQKLPGDGQQLLEQLQSENESLQAQINLDFTQTQMLKMELQSGDGQAILQAENERAILQAENERAMVTLQEDKERIIAELQAEKEQAMAVLKEDKEQAEAQHAAKVTELAALVQELQTSSNDEQLVGELERARAQLQAKESEVRSREAEHVAKQNELAASLDALRTELAACEAKQMDTVSQLEQVVATLQADKHELENREASATLAAAALQELQSNVEHGLQLEIRQLQDQLAANATENDKQLGLLQTVCASKELEFDSVVQTLRSELQATGTSKELLASLQSELDSLRPSYTNKTAELETSNQALLVCSAELTKLTRDLESAEAKLEETVQELGNERASKLALVQDAESKQEDGKALSALELEFAEYRARADGAFANAMREAEDAKGQMEAIRQTLADLEPQEQQRQQEHQRQLSELKEDAALQRTLLEQEMQAVRAAFQSKVESLQQALEVAETAAPRRVSELERELTAVQVEADSRSAESKLEHDQLAQELESKAGEIDLLKQEAAELTAQVQHITGLLTQSTAAATEEQQRLDVMQHREIMVQQRETAVQEKEIAVQQREALQQTTTNNHAEVKRVAARSNSLDMLETGGLLPSSRATAVTAAGPATTMDLSSSMVRSIPAQLQAAIADVVAKGDCTGMSRMKFTFGVLLYSAFVHLAMLGLYWRSCKEDLG
ncbi:hypothetical protein BASA81_007285 [Batrachochytrium salamandrivorans]|nr:hypothetical protein BASA81_007285 [Batrachochytrium salamandrivorans]